MVMEWRKEEVGDEGEEEEGGEGEEGENPITQV